MKVEAKCVGFKKPEAHLTFRKGRPVSLIAHQSSLLALPTCRHNQEKPLQRVEFKNADELTATNSHTFMSVIAVRVFTVLRFRQEVIRV